MEIKVDISELRKLEYDLGHVPARLAPKVVAVTKRAAHNIKTDWRETWTGYAHLPHLPKAVTYDQLPGVSHVRFEIGPDLDKKQGGEGWNIEFGGLHNAPIPGGVPALQKEEPKLVAHLELIMEEALDGRRASR